MADVRTKALLLDELRMVYQENDRLRARVAELEAWVSVDKITKSLEEIHELAKATRLRFETQRHGEEP